MKIIKVTLALAVVAMTAASCVENSAKYQTLLAQRDSLLVVDGNYHQTLDIMNEVEAGFQSIREAEGGVFSQITNPEQPQSKKQQLAEQLIRIKDILAQNREKIGQLEAQLSRNGKKNKALGEMIERLNSELTEKTALVESLQAELARKNIKIDELAGTIENLNTDVAKLNETSATQQATIASQDADLNSVAYIVASPKQLKELQIVTGNGLFKSKSVMAKEFDKTVFTKTDLRNLNSLATGSRKPKLLSQHPQDSYKFVTGDDKLVTIEITDPAKFWSVSKYLVVQQ